MERAVRKPSSGTCTALAEVDLANVNATPEEGVLSITLPRNSERLASQPKKICPSISD